MATTNRNQTQTQPQTKPAPTSPALKRFQPARKVQKKVKVLVYGEQGTGKTLFCLSWPGVAVIDTEGSSDLYGGRYDFLVQRTKSLTDIADTIEDVKADGGRTIQTLAIDPITVIWQTLQDAGQTAAEARAQRYGRGVYDVALTQRDWGVIKRRLYSAMIDLVNLPVNVVLTAHIRDIMETRQDSRGQEVQFKVGERPDAEKKTVYWVDVVVKLAVEDGQHVGIIEKDRSGTWKIGQRIPNISYRDFIPMLQAHAEGERVEQPHDEDAVRKDAALLETVEARPILKDIRTLQAQLSINDEHMTAALRRDYNKDRLEALTDEQAAQLKDRLQKALEKAQKPADAPAPPPEPQPEPQPAEVAA